MQSSHSYDCSGWNTQWSKFNLGRQGEASIINGSGLYNLILGSRKPEAKKFKKWVTSEVLPSIRKTGAYAMAGSEFQLPAPMTP